MKKDKKFLEELEACLGKTKYKDEIISKYDNLIKSEKANGKKIKYILKDLGEPSEIAKLELESYKANKSNIFKSMKEKFASFKLKKNNKEKKEKEKKNKKKENKEKKNIFASLKEKFSNKKEKKVKEDKKEKKEKKVKEEKNKDKKKVTFKERLAKFKEVITRDLTKKKERKITDTPKEIVEEVKEEVKDKISDVSEVVSETHIFETKAQRRKRIILKTLGIILTCLLAFLWLWVSVIFFASLFAYLDGVKFKGIIITAFSVDLLVFWIVIMVNRAIFKKKMSVKLNIIITFVLLALIALGVVLTFKEIKDIDYVQDVSDKYTMTRKLETYDLPKEVNEKYIITFNSNYNTQYVIKHDKNIKGKVKIETRYYECYYDYYVKTNVNGVYISLKLDDRDRFSVYLDDIKEGKIYDNDELSRYTVKISVNPDEANKIAIQ